MVPIRVLPHCEWREEQRLPHRDPHNSSRDVAAEAPKDLDEMISEALRDARPDIAKMISEELGEAERLMTPAPLIPQALATVPRTPLAHGEHILNQYANLCEKEKSYEPERSPEVALPVARVPEPLPAGKDHMISLIVKMALARIRR